MEREKEKGTEYLITGFPEFEFEFEFGVSGVWSLRFSDQTKQSEANNSCRTTALVFIGPAEN